MTAHFGTVTPQHLLIFWRGLDEEDLIYGPSLLADYPSIPCIVASPLPALLSTTQPLSSSWLFFTLFTGRRREARKTTVTATHQYTNACMHAKLHYSRCFHRKKNWNIRVRSKRSRRSLKPWKTWCVHRIGDVLVRDSCYVCWLGYFSKIKDLFEFISRCWKRDKDVKKQFWNARKLRCGWTDSSKIQKEEVGRRFRV